MKDSLHIKSDTIDIVSDSVVESAETMNYSEIFGGNIRVTESFGDTTGLFESMAPDWLSLVFIGSVIYYIVIKFILNIHLSEAFKGLLKIEVLDDVGFEKTYRSLAIFLPPFAIIVYSYYFYFIINPLYLQLGLDYLFFVSSLIISLIFLIKKLVEYFIAFVFNTRKAFNSYLLDHMFLLGISSIIQLILLIVYTYSQLKIALWASIAVLFIFFTFRLIRSFVIGYRLTQFSKSYLFLYLCSLEILPLIWIFKWMSDYQ